MSFSTVHKWFTKFISGQESVNDADYSGKQRSTLQTLKIKRTSLSLRTMCVSLSDSWHKWQTWVKQLSTSFWRKNLNVTKKSARWIPNLFTDEQKRTRVQMTKQLLKKYPKYQKKVFDGLVTGDETWVHFYKPKRKVDNRIWALKHAKMPSIAKRTLIAQKVLYAIFFRNCGPIMQIAVLEGRCVSGSFYKKVVLK